MQPSPGLAQVPDEGGPVCAEEMRLFCVVVWCLSAAAETVVDLY